MANLDRNRHDVDQRGSPSKLVAELARRPRWSDAVPLPGRVIRRRRGSAQERPSHDPELQRAPGAMVVSTSVRAPYARILRLTTSRGITGSSEVSSILMSINRSRAAATERQVSVVDRLKSPTSPMPSASNSRKMELANPRFTRHNDALARPEAWRAASKHSALQILPIVRDASAEKTSTSVSRSTLAGWARATKFPTHSPPAAKGAFRRGTGSRSEIGGRTGGAITWSSAGRAQERHEPMSSGSYVSRVMSLPGLGKVVAAPMSAPTAGQGFAGAADWMPVGVPARAVPPGAVPKNVATIDFPGAQAVAGELPGFQSGGTGSSSPMVLNGNLVLDGREIGTIVAASLSRDIGRPASGTTRFNPASIPTFAATRIPS